MAQEIADSTLLDTWGSSGAKIEPDISKIIEGWQLGEQPPHEYMNWIQNTFGSKLNHILKNGIAKWEPEKEFLAGATVQHSGNVWLSKTTNTNSAPTDVNANWERIITVESLTTVLGGYVATTGNQTIGGVKTFSLSPIVPTPTTDYQVANKKYVDESGSFTGAIIAKASSVVPSGFLECNGAELSRTTYANLFAVIGTTYGVGNGTTTFNIPDLRGEFIRGFDNGRGIDSGRTIGSFQADTFKSHTHSIYTYGRSAFDTTGGGLVSGMDTPTAGTTNLTTAESTGGNETRPRNIAMMYCIKY